GRHFLQIPGPTNVPDRVLRAMDRPVPDHRGGELPALVSEVASGLKQIFQTASGKIALFAASGTGGWEASLVNTLNPGERVLAFNLGQFSHLYAECARGLGAVVDEVDVPWGSGVPADVVHERLRSDRGHAYAAVLVVHNETSTGVTSNVRAVREAIDAAGHPALLLVDTVSSLASIDFRFDEWKVDVALAGTQKGLMLPPGMAVVCVGPRALARGEDVRSPRYFFDWRPVLATVAGVEMALTSAGVRIPLGAGVTACQKFFLEEQLVPVSQPPGQGRITRSSGSYIGPRQWHSPYWSARWCFRRPARVRRSS